MGRTCADCDDYCDDWEFSNNQWNKGNGYSRCMECIQGGQDVCVPNVVNGTMMMPIRTINGVRVVAIRGVSIVSIHHHHRPTIVKRADDHLPLKTIWICICKFIVPAPSLVPCAARPIMPRARMPYNMWKVGTVPVVTVRPNEPDNIYTTMRIVRRVCART